MVMFVDVSFVRVRFFFNVLLLLTELVVVFGFPSKRVVFYALHNFSCS